ncbi:MAG: hypothetical protein Q8M20_02015 [Rhodocyclaceae bacterium]|nr:hypothetical protein [Rhodocyclaceae bacterium]MDZ4216612.1 hypothetical protein [Rhodocyclaceae bacterium]
MSYARLPLLIILILVILLPVQHWVLEGQTNAAVGEVVSEATQAANTTVTKLFINEVYPRLTEPLALEGAGKRGEPLAGEALDTTDRTIRKFMFGTDIMKVKIYAMNGMTVYSTERAQIGEDKHDNPGFQSAAQGIPGSQITHRGKFSAIDGDVFDKDLVASYIPIRNQAGMIIGVAEIYTDRTPVLDKSTRGEGYIHAALLITQSIQLILLLLLGWLFWMRHSQPHADNNEFGES